jgi:hypothetical protein
MAEPAPAAAASAQQEAVSPETTHATPAPTPTSAQQASTRPEAPAPTQANPVRASQAPPNLVGMRAATLYAEPVDPAKPTEDVGWKWVKLGLVVIALLVALAALGLSLSILRFPKTLDLTRSYAIIASTVPLVSLANINSLTALILTHLLACRRHSLEHSRARYAPIDQRQKGCQSQRSSRHVGVYMDLCRGKHRCLVINKLFRRL